MSSKLTVHNAAGVAGSALSHEQGLTRVIGRFRRAALRFFPCCEIGWAFRHDIERHMRMLQSTELRALTPVNARFIRLQPLPVGHAGDHLRFARQLWRPELEADR